MRNCYRVCERLHATARRAYSVSPAAKHMCHCQGSVAEREGLAVLMLPQKRDFICVLFTMD